MLTTNPTRRERRVVMDGIETEVLRVPWYSQPNSYSCFPVSVKMVIEYFKSYYGNRVLQENIPDMPIDDIVELCKTDPYNGTRVDKDLVKEISNAIKYLKFEYRNGLDYSELKKETEEREIPCIVLYDGSYIRYRITGPAHAGVVIGFTSLDEIVLNNPWYGPLVKFNKKEFINAWEIYYNTAILVRPIAQLKLR